TEETILLSNYNNEVESSNQPTLKPSNKCSKKQKSSEHVPQKKWWEPVLLDNENTSAECLVKITNEKLCKKLYLNRNSTSNLIVHLAESHQITENIDIKEKSSEMFRGFLHDLDPGFIVPDVKLMKQIIHCTYNHTFPLIIQYIEDHVILINLTTDLWTAQNRQGYIGVTCCFLDKNFQLHELVLTVTYVRYPHTADHISDILFELLDQWMLREKVN
ncbi:1111_t:CDS:2, partial [Funneliformis geosporum]